MPLRTRAVGVAATMFSSAMLLLGGCTTMDAEDCARADWSRLGERDALAGSSVARLDQRAETCRSHGVTADAAAYRAGHARGAVQYCSPARGSQRGQAGESIEALCLQPAQAAYLVAHAQGLAQLCRPRRAYDFARTGGTSREVCPADLASGFDTGFRLGREVFDLNRRLKANRDDAAAQRRVIDNAAAAADARAAAQRRLADLDADEVRLRRMIRQAEVQALSLP